MDRYIVFVVLEFHGRVIKEKCLKDIWGQEVGAMMKHCSILSYPYLE